MADVIDDRGVSVSSGDDDVFGAAFDEKTGADHVEVAAEVPEKPVEPVEKPEEKVEKPVEKEKPVHPMRDAKPPDETDTQRYKTLQGIHRHDKEVWEQEKARLLADLEEAKKPKEEKKEVTPEQREKAEAFLDSLTDEQKAELAAYEEDFDVVSKMEGLKRERELKKLRKEMDDWKKGIEEKLNLAQTNIETKIEPATKMVEEREREAHFSAIRNGYTTEDGTVIQGHGDFEKYVKDGSIVAWIETKPKYMQTALMRTYSKGTPEDAIDLLTDFKRENNIEITQASDNVIPIDRKAEKKKALRAVDSRSVAVNSGKGLANDFEGAFEEALAKKSGG